MKKIILTVGLAFLLNACATGIHVKEEKQIEIKGRLLFSGHYQQDGENVDLSSLYDKLMTVDSVKDKVKNSKIMYYGSLWMFGIGTALAIDGATAKKNSMGVSQSSNGDNGLILVLIGGLISNLAIENLNESIDIYNKYINSNKVKTRPQFKLVPYLTNDQIGLSAALLF